MPVTLYFDIFFDLRLNKRLSKHREARDLRRYRAHYDVIVVPKIGENNSLNTLSEIL